MPLLRITLRLILGVDIRLHHASCWTRMIWSGPPGIVHQFHPAQFLENDATPILRRSDRSQSTLAFAAVLIAEYAGLAQAIAAQSMRAKQSREFFIDRTDRPPICYRRPNQPVHVLHRLNFGLDDAHPTFTIPPEALSQCLSIVYNTVVLETSSFNNIGIGMPTRFSRQCLRSEQEMFLLSFCTYGRFLSR